MINILENKVEKWRLRDVIYSYVLLNIVICVGVIIEYVLVDYIKLPFQLNDIEEHLLHHFAELAIMLLPIWFLIKRYPIIKLKDLIFFNKKKLTPFFIGVVCYGIIAIIGFSNIYWKSVPPLMLLINYKGFYCTLFLINLLVLAPFIEELFFRGLVFTILKNRFNFFWGMTVTAILFSVGHESWFNAIIRSIIFTYVYEKTNCLLFAILTHTFVNAMAIVSALITFYYF
ncbi:MAG: CPBP family intramembrane metalloprotease [Deltaproteobacteria bacterium]|nr:MAG: CPBP family intramembrane metalloprotease [Deltaproteobacteria bacterium]